MSATAQAVIPRKVTVIPIDPQLAQRDIRKKHLRVAPYCRVMRSCCTSCSGSTQRF